MLQSKPLWRKIKGRLRHHTEDVTVTNLTEENIIVEWLRFSEFEGRGEARAIEHEKI